MKTVNKLLFENLNPNEYAKNFETIEQFDFRQLDAYADILGFDEHSQGWVVVHRHHAVSGLFDELPTCRILKTQGYAVTLIAESNQIVSADALINGVIYEFKRISSATNLPRAIEKQLRLAYKKSENIALHIDQAIEADVLVSALRKAAFNHSGIQQVLLIWKGEVIPLTRQEILKSQWLKQK